MEKSCPLVPFFYLIWKLNSSFGKKVKLAFIIRKWFMIQVDYNKDYRHRMHLNNQHLVRLNWPPVLLIFKGFIFHEYNESARYSYDLVFEAISISAYKTKQIWIRIILPGSEAHFLTVTRYVMYVTR